jgi:PAS domain S-box-containing protein
MRAIATPDNIEQEFQDCAGHWYSAVARPYRTVDGHVGGAVITIGDIHALKCRLAAAEKAWDCAAGVIETVREPLVVLDSELRVQRATSAFYETFLLTPKEIQGRHLYELGNGQWDDPRLRELLHDTISHDTPFRDYKLERDFPHMGRRTFCLNGQAITGRESDSPQVLLAVEDVSDRPEVAELWFRRLFETAKDGIMVVDAETYIIADINPWFLSVTGFSREDVVGKKFSEAEPIRTLPQARNIMSSVKAAELVRFDDLPLRKADGSVINMELVANLYQVGTRSIAQFNFRDISVRKEEEEILRRSLEEKALLVREIHHRVKNNLQVIVSLLSLQAGYTQDPNAIAAFEEMERRVRAIARIHETLYASPDLAQIEFATYLSNLTRELLTFHQAGSDAIELDLITEEMVLQMEQAIPLGLIANELILNSLKHGLADRKGRLAVTLRYRRDANDEANQSLDEGWAHLQVSDDGPGLPPHIDLAHARSMGLRLLHLLVTQLRGEVEFLPGPGAHIRVDFPLAYPADDARPAK